MIHSSESRWRNATPNFGGLVFGGLIGVAIAMDPFQVVLLLMEEILHHLGCMKPYK